MSQLRIRIELDLYDDLDITVSNVDQSVADKLVAETLRILEEAKTTQTNNQ